MKNLKLVILALVFLLSLSSASAVQQLLSLQGKVDYNGVLVRSGNLTVTIYDAATGGNLIYNSTRDFDMAIVDGYFDVMLGSARNLSMQNNGIYYLDLTVNGTDLDWGSDERKQFQSPVGTNFTGDTNFTFDTNTLFVDSTNNNVGIGTTSPTTKLHLIGDLNVTANATIAGGLLIGANDYTKTGSYFLNVSGNASINNTFFVNTNGNVGIGTTSPGVALEVKVNDAITNAVTNVLQLSHATTGTAAPGIGTGIVFQSERVSDGGLIDINAIESIMTDTQVSGGTYEGALIFKTRANSAALTEKVRIDKAGNVGIGTTNPKGLTELAFTDDSSSYGNYSEITKLWRTSFGAITDTNWHTTTTITLNGKGFGGVTIEYFVKVITYDTANTYGTFYRKWVAGRDNNNGGMLAPTLIDSGNSNDPESAVDVQITTSGTPDNTLLLQVKQTANHGGLSSFNYVRIFGVDIDSVSYS